jgi:DNA-binding SARP family transcriptional activator
LARLRKTLGEESTPGQEEVGFLVIEGDLLGLEPHRIYLDLKALEAGVALSMRETCPAGSTFDTVERRDLIARLEGDLGLYRGEFIEGFSVEDAPEFELWVEGERTRWRWVFEELCVRLSRLQSEAAQLEEAIATARVWVRHSPLEEGAHRRLMELFSSAGESEGALMVYEGYRDTLSRGLKVEPSAQMQELAHRLHAEVQERASLGASLARLGDIIAGPLSELDVPLVGRHEEFGALVSEYHAASAGETAEEKRMSWRSWERLDRQDALGRGVPSLGQIQRGRCPERRSLRRSSATLRAAHRGDKATHGARRAPDDLLEDVWLSELCRLLPELKERYPDLPSPTFGEGEMAKGALFEAIARLVGALTSRAPAVLFLDDLQ